MMKKNLIFQIVLFLAVSLVSVTNAQSNIDALKTESLRQMQYGRYGEAIDLLNRYISARPQESIGYNLRGICYEKRRDYENADYDYKSALKIEPSNKEYSANLARATAAWQSLLYNNIEGHKREIAINPKIAVNYLEIGKDYKRLGDWDLAEDWYDQYLAREEASADEIIRYSEILAKNEHIAKGWPILKKYTEKYPNDQRLWSKFGYFSMWLGKTRIAIDAFEHALALKPFFKEALDGLDQARGRGYHYTINDTSVKYNYGMPVPQAQFVYPIDKHYRQLKRNPSNNDLRFTLVEELIKAKRYEEAREQLKILMSRDTTKTETYHEYLTNVTSIMDSVYNLKIEEFKAQLAADSSNTNAMLKLADYYSRLQKYDSAIPLYEKYLDFNPNDNDMLFKYAQVLSWNREFEEAIPILDELLAKKPDNLKYQLLRAQMAVWLRRDLDLADTYLNNILSNQPENIDALVSKASLEMQKNNFAVSQTYMDQIKSIDPFNDIVIQLQNDLELQKSRYEQEKTLAILYEARDFAYNNKCEEALPKYEEYIAKAQPNILITREYADANVCARHYEKAIQLYDEILNQDYDNDVAIQRAKTFYYMGDSVKALAAFEKLQKDNPKDFSVNMYLGDSYARMKDYSNARDTYNNILDNMSLDSSQTEMIVQRKGWLPVTGFSGILDTFPYYTLISPYASYYGDNFGFKYFTQGLRIDLGVTQFLSLGAEAFRNTLKSNTLSANYNNIRWNIGLRLTPNVSMGVGFGSSYYGNNDTKPIANGYIRIEKPDLYSVNATYSKADAALVVFSPTLVGSRQYATTYGLSANYLHSSGIRISSDVTYLTLPLDNSGLNFDFRIGKYFYPELIIGYDYYSSSYLRTVAEYYSPQGFSSHSIYSDWDLIKNENATVTIGGRIGMISNSDTIIREIYGLTNLKLADAFSIQGSLRIGSTAQNNFGYNSVSSYLAVYWSL
jgi:tetratricopeptide (TPR) repeat protein